MAVRADVTELDLDLRQSAHLEKSVLLLQQEFAVDLIEAGIWGSTLESAATAIAHDRAVQVQAPPDLLADLREAIAPVMERIWTSTH